LSRIEQTVAHFRDLLMKREAASQQVLDAAFQQVLTAINPALERLYGQMTDALGGGDQLSLSWLYEANRLEVIKQSISGQIDQYAALAKMTTGVMQHDGVKIGLDAAIAMLNVSKPPTVAWSFGEPDQRAIQNIVGVTQAGSPLADLFAGFGREASQKVSAALITGVILGDNPRKVARDVQESLGVSRNRALVISRQEMLRCYKSAQIESYRANDDVVESYMWLAKLDARTCAACLAMHGTIHPLSQPMESHVCCRCSQTPITKPWSEILGPLGIDTSNIPETRFQTQTGVDWFHDQSAGTQTKILGPMKYDAWKKGKFDFADIVKKTHDPDWGGSIQEKPLRELVKAR